MSTSRERKSEHRKSRRGPKKGATEKKPGHIEHTIVHERVIVTKTTTAAEEPFFAFTDDGFSGDDIFIDED